MASSQKCFLIFSFLTFPRYKQFGTKLSPIFGFAKSSKYKPIFPLSLLPKLLVACVGGSVVFSRNCDYKPIFCVSTFRISAGKVQLVRESAIIISLLNLLLEVDYAKQFPNLHMEVLR